MFCTMVLFVLKDDVVLLKKDEAVMTISCLPGSSILCQKYYAAADLSIQENQSPKPILQQMNLQIYITSS